YRGVVEHSRVQDVMAGYDVFFLPTLGENFGHVIMEAMAAGTPVLISDRTPWHGLADLGVGHDLPLANEDAFVAALESYSGMFPEVREAQRSRVAAYATRMAREGDGVQRNRALFHWAMGMADQDGR
ncbi:group 1 glycosyl transferase, partial [mine drainage metagenome]